MGVFPNIGRFIQIKDLDRFSIRSSTDLLFHPLVGVIVVKTSVRPIRVIRY